MSIRPFPPQFTYQNWAKWLLDIHQCSSSVCQRDRKALNINSDPGKTILLEVQHKSSHFKLWSKGTASVGGKVERKEEKWLYEKTKHRPCVYKRMIVLKEASVNGRNDCRKLIVLLNLPTVRSGHSTLAAIHRLLRVSLRDVRTLKADALHGIPGELSVCVCCVCGSSVLCLNCFPIEPFIWET